MELGTYQRSAHATAIYPIIGHPVIYPVLGLVNETGEVAGKLKKVFRDSQGKIPVEVMVALAAELGDVLWYLSETATALGLDLDFIAQGNLDKLADRAQRGALQGNGDNR